MGIVTSNSQWKEIIWFNALITLLERKKKTANQNQMNKQNKPEINWTGPLVSTNKSPSYLYICAHILGLSSYLNELTSLLISKIKPCVYRFNFLSFFLRNSSLFPLSFLHHQNSPFLLHYYHQHKGMIKYLSYRIKRKQPWFHPYNLYLTRFAQLYKRKRNLQKCWVYLNPLCSLELTLDQTFVSIILETYFCWKSPLATSLLFYHQHLGFTSLEFWQDFK